MDAATTTPEFVLVVNGEEAGRYEKKASANKGASRARKGGATAEVLTADNWDNQDGVVLAPTGPEATEAAAVAELEEAAHLASEGFVPAGGVEPAEGDDEDDERDGADLAAAEVVEEAEEVTADAVKAEARKLTLAERRALAAPLHEAARRVLAELDLSAPGLENVTARDAEACVGLWMWYLPNGKQWDDAL